MNQVTLLGNLCADPEVKDGNGFTVATMRIAVNERRKSKEGEWIDCATFIRLVAFGMVAERIQKVLCKGTRVVISGKVKVDSWEDRATGKKRSETLIEVKDFWLGGGGRSREESQERGESSREYNQDPPPRRATKDNGSGRGQYSRRDEGEYYPEYDEYH